jgi:transposase
MKKTERLAFDLKNLPTDVALLHSIIESIAFTNERLLHQLREANRRQFGRKAESVSELQMALFEQQIQAQLAAMPKLEVSPVLPKEPGAGHGRGIPADSIPRHNEHYPLAAEQKTCPDCSTTLKKIGTESRNVVEYIPSSLVVRVQTCEKWACPCCMDKVVTSDLPDLPVAKGMAGEGLLAHVVTSKYADHLPLYRQSVILKRQGYPVSRSTLGDWVAQVADKLKPVYLAMKADVLKSKVIHSDDTTVPVLAEKDPENRSRKRKAGTGRLWTWVGDKDHPHIVYSFSANRRQQWPLDFIGGWRGYLQADAYSGYHPLYARGIKEVACWAHARRKYVEAMETDPARGQSAVAFIHKLYDVEREAKAMSPRDRKRLRLAHAKPVLDAFKGWLDAQALITLPKSVMGQAMAYSLNQWAALNSYLKDGDLAIDNNAAERAIRGIALGRKNWLFAGSNEGGERAAILYSVIESCKRHGVDPFEYLRDVIAEIAGVPPRRVKELMPATWKATRQEQSQAA